MKEKKDKKLSELFRGYTESAKMPDENVTEKAKRLLESPETVLELSLAPAASGAGNGAAFTPRRKKQIGIAAAVFAGAALLVIFFLLIRIFSSASNIVLDWSQLYNITNGDSYREKDFVPFVREEEVLQYDEFGLSEESPYYEEYAGDVILYYLQYESNGVMVDLIIEIDGFTLDELDGYEEIENDFELDDFVLYIEPDESTGMSYAYFAFDAYQYYLQIHTTDEDLLYAVLAEIVFSF